MVAKKHPRGVDCDIVWCRDAALAPGVGRAGRIVAATRAICDANCCTRRDAPRRFAPHALPADCRNHCNYCEKYSFVRVYTHIIIIQPLSDLHKVYRCINVNVKTYVNVVS